MIDMDLETFWKNTLVELSMEVSKANFMTLFKPTKLLSLDNGIATIGAPSVMVIDLLKKRFLPLIEEVLEKQTKEKTTVAFLAKSSLASGQKDSKKNLPLFQEEGDPPPTQVTPISRPARVRPDYTFATLAVSSSNQLAFISAQTVAKNIGGSYNPLFIYGPVGVGKTHLMQAVANDVFLKDVNKKIVYITSEEFTNEVVEAIRSNDTARMKRRFRTADILIIDDVQFIAGKDRVQEELFHTFNILIDNGAQIILSSDRPPHEIQKLEKRLSSRFAGGLTVDIEAPDFELRTAILLIKARKFNIDLPIEVAKILADKVSDVRSLEGVLLRVITEAQATGGIITEALAQKAIGGKLEEERGARMHPDDVIKSVCQFYGVKATALRGPKRDASLVKARQVTMYLLRKEVGLSLVEVGNALGGRDHTTVMHGVGKIEQQLSTKGQVSMDILGIKKSFGVYRQ